MTFSSFAKVACIAAALTILYGCTTTRPPLEREIPEEFPYHSADQIMLNLRHDQAALHSYRARAAISIRSAENGGQFSAEMHARKNDSIYVSISPGLGIEAARALVTPDSFFFYDRIKNRLVYGSVDEAGDILPQPFTSENLFENLLGLVGPPADTEWEVSSDSAYYYLHDTNGTMTYVIDPAFWRVVRFEEQGAGGDLLERRTYSEFDQFDDTVVPRRLVFDRPGDDQRASIYYRDLTLNPDRLSFSLRVRDSAERVRAGE